MRKKASKKPAKRKSSGQGTVLRRTARNIYVVMLMKLTAVLLLLFLSRFLFYMYNFSYFPGLSFNELSRIFLAGLRFDISAVLIINAVFILMNTLPFRFRYKRIYQGISNGYFYLANAVALMVNFIDIIYFRFNLKRMTSDVFRFLKVGGDFDRLVPQFIGDFWDVLLIWIGFVIIMVIVCRRLRISGSAPKISGFGYYFFATVLFALCSFLSVIGIRGGFQLRPIGLVTAGSCTTSRDAALVLNTPFTISRTFFHKKVDRSAYFSSEADMTSIYTPVHKAATGKFRPYNVLIIVMESFSREHIGFLNKDIGGGKYQGFTPVFDSLIQEGTYFEGFANGKTSITGIPAILSSIPTLMNEPFTQSPYAANDFTSIAGLLKQKGYTSAFFHGGTNGTMGYDVYTKMTGFDYYFGRTEYNDERDYDGKWGIRDEEFLQFAARKIDKLKEPFAASVFTLSAHHPYFVPGKFRHKFREGNLPIQQSIMYSDYALGRFISTISKMSWYGKTIIAITADHTSEGYFPYYKGPVGQYAIPILILFPAGELKGIYREIAQQTDILPTILSYMGFDLDYIAFGSDMLAAAAPHFSVHYNAGIYTLIKNGYVLEFDGNSSISLYEANADPRRKVNKLSSRPETAKEMEFFLKAFIQQYNNRLIENRLTIR